MHGKDKKKNLFLTQLYFYKKLALMVRYLFEFQGRKNIVFYQNLMDRIREKYLDMLKTSKVNKKRVKKWIIKYRKKNKKEEIKRGKKNAAATIDKKRREREEQKSDQEDGV